MFHFFLLCSGLAALVNLCAGYVLYGLLGLDGTFGFGLSVSLAFMAGMVVSFVLNRRYTYGASGRSTTQELRDFFAVSLIGLLLTTLVAQLLNVSGAGAFMAQIAPVQILPETAAHIGAVGFTALYSFFAHKYVSFRKAENDNYNIPNWERPLEQAG